MVAVRNYDADRFVANRPPDSWLVLVHGSDAGLISERVRTLARRAVDDPDDPFQLVRLEADHLAVDPGRLVDEIRTVPLFGGRRGIVVEAGSKNFGAAIETALGLPRPCDCTVIIEAGSLRRDAPLRQLVERAKHGAAVECTADGAQDITRLVQAEAKAAGFVIADDARDALGQLLGADRLTTRSEIEKLFLYAHGKPRISLDDVEAIVADASPTAMDAAVDGAFLGDFSAIETTVERLLAEGGDAGVLLGAALRHALLLQRTRLEVDGGRPVSVAAQAAIGFGLFFKRKPAFERQLKGWTSQKLMRAIETLAEAVARGRRDARLMQAIAMRALWSVARAARSG